MGAADMSDTTHPPIRLHLGTGWAVYDFAGLCHDCKTPVYKRTSDVGDDGRVGNALAVFVGDVLLCPNCAKHGGAFSARGN
jgi:hypothetical protein